MKVKEIYRMHSYILLHRCNINASLCWSRFSSIFEPNLHLNQPQDFTLSIKHLHANASIVFYQARSASFSGELVLPHHLVAFR